MVIVQLFGGCVIIIIHNYVPVRPTEIQAGKAPKNRVNEIITPTFIKSLYQKFLRKINMIKKKSRSKQ